MTILGIRMKQKDCQWFPSQLVTLQSSFMVIQEM